MFDREGSYRAKTLGADLCTSKNGKAQVAVRFEGTEGDGEGHHITGFFSLTEAALKYTVEKLRTLGWRGVDLSDLSTVGSAGDVEIVIRADEFEGKVTCKVAFVNALGSGGAAIKGAMNDADKRAFAQRMRGLVVGLDPKQAKVAPVTTLRQDPPPHTDEEIPF